MRDGLRRAPRRSRFTTLVLAVAATLMAIPGSPLAPQAVHAAISPTVSSLSPQAGPSASVTTVTITGSNFDSTAAVSFGSVAATSVTVVSSTQLTVVTPASPQGQVPVTVTTTAGGTSAISAPWTTFQFTNPGPFHPLTTRICDTRAGTGTLCSGSGSDYQLPPTTPRIVQVTGVGGVPTSGVAAVAMDLFIAPTAGSYGNVGVFPTGLAGGASNLSWVNGNFETLLIEIPVSPQVLVAGQWTGGQVTINNSWSSNGSVVFIMDVQGYVADSQSDASGLINSLTSPTLVCHTGTSGDGCYVPGNAGLGPGIQKTFTVRGVGSVPVSGVSAVVLNVQAYAENNAGWLVIYPAGQPRPATASMLWNAWTPLTSNIIVPVDSTGQLAVYNGGPGATQLTADVVGWFSDNSDPSATGGLYYPNNGTLVCDTIANTNTPCSGGGQLGTGSQNHNPLSVQITGQGGVPQAPTLTGVELSITVTNVNLPPGSGTNICVYPSNGSCQEAALNLYGGVPANLLVVVPVGPDGKVYLSTPTGSMDVLVAVTGYYGAPASVRGGTMTFTGGIKTVFPPTGGCHLYTYWDGTPGFQQMVFAGGVSCDRAWGPTPFVSIENMELQNSAGQLVYPNPRQPPYNDRAKTVMVRDYYANGNPGIRYQVYLQVTLTLTDSQWGYFDPATPNRACTGLRTTTAHCWEKLPFTFYQGDSGGEQPPQTG